MKYADKFIAERNFDALYELVHADHKIHDRKRNKDGFFDNEEDAKLDSILSDLEGDVLTYVRLIEPDFESINDDDLDDFSGGFIGEDSDW